jgi:hypothetical protein
MATRQKGRAAPDELAEPLLEIAVDDSKMFASDLRFLSRARRGEVTDEESLDFFARVLVGGEETLARVPINQLHKIWAAIFAIAYGKPSEGTDPKA